MSFADELWADKDAGKAATPTLFAALHNQRDAARGEQATARPLRVVQPTTTDVTTAYGQRALDGEADAVRETAEGSRNARLNQAACAIGNLIAGGEITEDDAREALTDAAQDAGLDHHEIKATIASGFRKGMTTPRSAPVDDFSWIAEPAVTERTDVPPRLDWAALWSEPDDEEWIIEPLLPARRLVALYSSPKVGKSLLMLELAVGIARGTRVLGYLPDRARRVLYVDFENDPRGDIRTRLQAMHVGPEHLDNLVYLSFPTMGKLDNERGAVDLLAAVAHYAAEVVVIDTVSRAVAGPENENDTWLDFYRHTGLALKQAGVAMIRLDHAGKDAERGQRGGSAKEGDVDAVWRLSKVNDSTLTLHATHTRFSLMPEQKTLTLHRRADPLRHDVDAAGAVAAWSIEIIDRMKVCDELGLSDQASREVVREALTLHWQGTDRRVGSNVLLGRVVEARRARNRPGRVSSEDPSEVDGDGNGRTASGEQ